MTTYATRGIQRFFWHFWERKLFLAVLLLFCALYFTWEVILEEPPAPPQPQVFMPTPPEIIPWNVHGDTPPFLKDVSAAGIGNPFQIKFPVAKPQTAQDKDAQETPAPETQPELPPPPPPRRTVAVTFRGVRKAITGKTFAILEYTDSQTGGAAATLPAGSRLPGCTLEIAEVTERSLRLTDDRKTDRGEVPYGATKIITLENDGEEAQ